jgi:PAS domain-containing protein
VQVTPIFDAPDALLGTKIIFIDTTRQHELQEELQRSRQELETTNEERQSTNEELETVNEELRQRGTDLGRSNVFLTGILCNVPFGVIVLDHELQVELWNDVAADIWGLRRDEVQVHCATAAAQPHHHRGSILLMSEVGRSVS